MSQRSLVVRALWFVSVGWWATPAVVNVAWFLNATVIGILLGVALINLVPTVFSLKEPKTRLDPDSGCGQRSVVVRVVYLVLVGWWLSWVWANVAVLFTLTIVGLPVGIWMFNRFPAVTSLYRLDG